MPETDDESVTDEVNNNYEGSLKFLVEKCKKLVKPLHIYFLNAQYQALGGTDVSQFCWNKKFRKNLHKSENLDRNTRAQILFILSTPVTMDFLRKLRKSANVELDEFFRITRFRSFNGDVEFGGAHMDNSCHKERHKRLRELLAKMAQETENPIGDSDFLEKYPHFSKTFLTTIKQRFFDSTQFDEETKIKVLFWTRTPLHPYVLERLRRDAVVKIDQRKRIIKYSSERLEMDGILWYSTSDPNRMWRNIERGVNEDIEESTENVQSFRFENEMAQLIKLLLKVCEKAVCPMGRDRLCSAYRGNAFTKEEKMQRINQLSVRLPSLDSIDLKTRVKMMFMFCLPLTDSHLEMFRENAVVEVNTDKHIIKYEANDGSLSLEDGLSDLMESDESSDSDESETSEDSDSEVEEDPDPVSQFERVLINRVVDENDSAIDRMMNDFPEVTNSMLDMKPIPESERNKENASVGPSIRMEQALGISKTETVIIKVSSNSSDANSESIDRSKKRKSNGNGLSSMEKKSRRSADLDPTSSYRAEEPMDLEYPTPNDGPSTSSSHLLRNRNSNSRPTNSTVIDEITLLANQDTMDSTRFDISNSRPISNVIPAEKHENFLKHLRDLIEILEIPDHRGLRTRIERKITEIGSIPHEIRIIGFSTSFKSCVQEVFNNSKDPPFDGSISLREFLLFLRNAVVSMELPALGTVVEDVKEFTGKDSMQTRRIPMDNVFSALETILDIVAP